MAYTRKFVANLLRSDVSETLGYTVFALDGTPLIDRSKDGVVQRGSQAAYDVSVAGWDESWSGRIEFTLDDGTFLCDETFLPTSTAVSLDTGTVSASTSATAFSSATTALDATTGHYNDMQLFFTSGANAGSRRRITSSTRTGGTTAFVTAAFAETPGVGDAFAIG